MTTYIHMDLWRLTCKCYTFRKKDTHLNIIERFYEHKVALFDNQLYDKHTIFSQYKFDTVFKNWTFHPTFYLMPSLFYVPVHYSPTPQSQIMPFLPSVGFQYSQSAHYNIISAQQWAAFTVHHILCINSEQLPGIHQYCASCGVTLTGYVWYNHI